MDIKQTDPMELGDRKSWIQRTADLIHVRFINKFMTGMATHGGDIGHVPTYDLLDEMEQEALDQLAYVRELKRRFRQE